MDCSIFLDAPCSELTGLLPRLAARAAPAASCCTFERAGMIFPFLKNGIRPEQIPESPRFGGSPEYGQNQYPFISYRALERNFNNDPQATRRAIIENDIAAMAARNILRN